MSHSFDIHHVLSSLCTSLHAHALIIPGKDPHQLEGTLSQFKFRHFLSKFEGSAGTLIIYNTEPFFKCALWTDGRYEAQLKVTAPPIIEIHTGKEKNWQEQLQWIVAHHTSQVPDTDLHIAVCDLQMSAQDYLDFQNVIDTHATAYRITVQLHAVPYTTFINVMSTHIPSIMEYLQTPEQLEDVVGDAVHPYINTIYSVHALQKTLNTNSNSTATDETQELSLRYKALSDMLHAHTARCYLSANPFELAWITGTRSLTLQYTMMFPAVFIFNRHDHTLCIWMSHSLLASHSFELFHHLDAHTHYTTIFKHYNELLEDTLLQTILQTHDAQHIVYDPTNIPHALYHSSFRPIKSPLLLWKSIRTPEEIEMMQHAQNLESVLLCNAMYTYTDTQKKGTSVTEQEVDEYIQTERKKVPCYIQPSFKSIIASGANAAYPHYMNTTSSPPVHDTLPLLIDTGAHYCCGTTDITRVFFLPASHHPPPALLIEDYTLVLKAHIQVALYTSAPIHNKEIDYPEGRMLDERARKTLHDHNRTYNHGTGHGIGYCSDVHEGVQTCAPLSTQKIFPNMIISNEPGYYRVGYWGIRLENIVRTYLNKDNQLAIETITWFPFQNSLINKSLLSAEELAWLDAYHKTCERSIYPLLSENAKIFFKTLVQ